MPKENTDKIKEKQGKATDISQKTDDAIEFKIKKARIWQLSLFIVAVIAIFVWLGDGLGSDGITGSAVAEIPDEDKANEGHERITVSTDDDPVLGSEGAPVTIISFEDYQCPFCKRTFQQTFPLLKKEYIDTGKVRYIFRDFPLARIHSQAVAAAHASECADEQGRYWSYHDYLYQNQQQLGMDLYLAIARELGLDTEKFTECMDSNRYLEEIKKDFNDGVDAGVTGTPAFFINGIKLVGTHPFQSFKEIIDEELAAKS